MFIAIVIVNVNYVKLLLTIYDTQILLVTVV